MGSRMDELNVIALDCIDSSSCLDIKPGKLHEGSDATDGLN